MACLALAANGMFCIKAFDAVMAFYMRLCGQQLALSVLTCTTTFDESKIIIVTGAYKQACPHSRISHDPAM